MNERARVVYNYVDGKVSFGDLIRLYPFVAAEIVAENFDVLYFPKFQAALRTPYVRSALIAQGWAT